MITHIFSFKNLAEHLDHQLGLTLSVYAAGVRGPEEEGQHAVIQCPSCGATLVEVPEFQVDLGSELGTLIGQCDDLEVALRALREGVESLLDEWNKGRDRGS